MPSHAYTWDELSNIAQVIVLLINIAVIFIAGGKFQQKVTSMEKRVDENEDKVEAALEQFRQFELEAARTFVTSTMLRDAETRIINAIGKLSDRIDVVFDGRNGGHIK